MSDLAHTATDLFEQLSQYIARISDYTPTKYANLSKDQHELSKMCDEYQKLYADTDYAHDSRYLVEIPKPVFDETVAKWEEAHLPIPKHYWIDNEGMVNIIAPASLAPQYKDLAVQGLGKECTLDENTNAQISKISAALKNDNIEFSLQGTRFIVNPKNKEYLDRAFMKYESIEKKVDEPLAKMVVQRMKKQGIPCAIAIKDGNAYLQYIKADKDQINKAIDELKETRAFTEADFKAKFAGQKCVKIPLKDDVELSTFMDMAVGRKFDYAFSVDEHTGITSILVPDIQKDVAFACKDEMLRQLYEPLNYDEYIIAQADKKISEKIADDIIASKGVTRYFVSAQHPDYFIKLEDQTLTVHRRMSDSHEQDGNVVTHTIDTLHSTDDRVQVYSKLAYLGTPIEIKEADFDEKLIGVGTDHPYQSTIDKEILKACDGKTPLTTEERTALEEILEGKTEYYLSNRKELEKALDVEVGKGTITPEIKSNILERAETFEVQSQAEVETVVLTENIDDRIDRATEQANRENKTTSRETEHNFGEKDGWKVHETKTTDITKTTRDAR